MNVILLTSDVQDFTPASPLKHKYYCDYPPPAVTCGEVCCPGTKRKEMVLMSLITHLKIWRKESCMCMVCAGVSSLVI